MSESKKLTYKAAIAEMEQIISQIEGDELDVDTLAQRIKRVSELIEFCRAKLFATENEVQKLLQNLTPSDEQEER